MKAFKNWRGVMGVLCMTLVVVSSPLSLADSLLTIDERVSAGARMTQAEKLWASAFRRAGVQRELRQFEAIEMLFTSATRQQARRYLDAMIDWRIKDHEQLRVRRQLARAALAYLDAEPAKALELLPALRTLAPPQQIIAMDVRARSLWLLGRPLESLEARSELGSLVRSKKLSEKNRKLISARLEDLSDSELDTLMRESRDRMLAGWAELVLIERNTPAARLENRLEDWTLRHPDHPAEQIVIPSTALPPPVHSDRLERVGQSKE